ncbi:MAG: ABC transporter substrate-binding protein [Planctomycetota bacterium]
MRYFWMALFGLLLIALAVGPRLFLRQTPADERLLIISPHWDGIRYEFGRAFSEHYLNKFGKRIEVVWMDVGGTGEIRKYLDQKFNAAKSEEGVSADLLFGGGMDMLAKMARKNYFEPVALSAAQQQALPAAVNGQELRDQKNRYHAACLSSFGFVYNKLVLENARLPAPRTWDDLGCAEFHGWVSCGDPTTSGSLHQAFELVLQGQGWERGYTTLTRLLSNVRATNEGGTSIPRDVSLGQAAVGPCIDFYASAPVRRQGATHLQLVIPAGIAVATPDCIAVLRHPPNRTAAFAFVTFVLSEAGQKLWYLKRGTPGGPIEYDLERLPVMPEIYTRFSQDTWTVTNPFKGVADFQYDSKKGGRRWDTLNDLWRAAILDVHEDLWNARQAVIRAGRDLDLGYALARPPISEQAVNVLAEQALLADERNALKNQWTGWARVWFKAITTAALKNGPVPEFQSAKTSVK